MKKNINVPQCDPKAGYLEHKTEIEEAIKRVLDSGRYILGGEVESFEKSFAAYIGVSHGVGVGNGTDALELSLRACGVGRGDLVFTVSHTAVATVAAIESAGAVPVLVDIDSATYTIDPGSLSEALKNSPVGRAKAVIPVHLYGQPSDMREVMRLAKKHGLRVIEDCAQSHGATLDGRKAGAWGDIAAFSFYPTKNLGAMGDGGMALTSDPALAERVRLLRQYGWRQRYVSDIAGKNSRLDEMQAAILNIKLKFLDKDNSRRIELAGLYSGLLKTSGLSLPFKRAGASHVFHQYVVRSSERDVLARRLKQKGVETNIHYPAPVHLQPAYLNRLGKVVPLDNTEKAAREVLSLPMYPQLTEEMIRHVCRDI